MRAYDRKRIKLQAFQKLEIQLMPTRVESTIYAKTSIDSPQLPEFLKAHNLKVFAFMLFVYKEVIKQYPSIHRFVLGGKLYEHKEIIVSTVVKKDKSVVGNNTFSKITLKESMSVFEVSKALNQTIQQARSTQGNQTDTLIDSLHWMPGLGFKLLQKTLSVLDKIDLLPNEIIKSDPLHASLIIANLGSIDGFDVNHHLYNWGTASMFVTFGRLDKAGHCDVSFSVDERISEGMVLFKALNLFKHIMEHPYDYV